MLRSSDYYLVDPGWEVANEAGDLARARSWRKVHRVTREGLFYFKLQYTWNRYLAFTDHRLNFPEASRYKVKGLA